MCLSVNSLDYIRARLPFPLLCSAGFLAPIGGAFCSWVTLLRKTVLISLADDRAEKLMEPLPGEPGSEEGETWGLPRHQRLRKALLGMLEQPQDTPGAAGVDGHKLLAIAQHIENAVGTRQLQARGEGGGSSFCRRGERATGSRSVPLPPQAPFVCPPPPQEDLQALLKLPGPGDPPPNGAKPEWRKQLNRRIALLRGIPFRAILTTNFTDVFGYGQELTGGAQDLVTALRGRVEAEEAFRSSLEAIDDRRCACGGRCMQQQQGAPLHYADPSPAPAAAPAAAAARTRRTARWRCCAASWTRAAARTSCPCTTRRPTPPCCTCTARTRPSSPSRQVPVRGAAPLLSLGGCAYPFALSHAPPPRMQGYRRLLHRTAGYQPFVTTLLATSTVCYFGFRRGGEGGEGPLTFDWQPPSPPAALRTTT